MKVVHALVDYDNAKGAEEKRPSDVASNLLKLMPRLTMKIKTIIPDAQEIRFRFYGGWIALDGQTTFQGGWMFGEISNHRGRYGRVRAQLTMATSLTARPELVLIGTYRDKAQKMVDSMICSDLIDLAHDEYASLVVVSDDDDFIPGIISGSVRRSRGNPIFLLRDTKRVGFGPNDKTVEDCAVRLENY